MKPAPFDYHRAHTLDEALALLAEHGDEAKPLAGGQSLIPAMNFRLAAPAVLVDLNAIDELAYIRAESGSVHLGAMTRHMAVERSDTVSRLAPLVHDAMPFIAHAAIRTRGTIGGSLAHADPAAELPAVMLALDARLVARRANGAREIPASEFFTGLFATALEPGELLTEIRLPAGAAAGRHGAAFREFSRRHGDFALAGVAAVVTLDGDADARGTRASNLADARCTRASIALFGVGERPLLAARAAAALVGEVPSPDVIRAAAAIAASDEIDPTSDIHASSRYRRHLAEVLTRRALHAAFDRANSSLQERPRV